MAVVVDLFNDFVEKTRADFNINHTVDPLDVVRIYAWFDLRRLPQKQWKVYLILQQNSEVGVKPFFYYSNIPTHKLRVIYNHS